jgi:hypothetical protein
MNIGWTTACGAIRYAQNAALIVTKPEQLSPTTRSKSPRGSVARHARSSAGLQG